MTTAAPVTRKPRIDDADARRLREEHDAGSSVRKLANARRVGCEAVKRAIRRVGGTVQTRPKSITRRAVTFPGVRVVEQSGNRKLGDCAATYAAAATCPDTCPFINNGCYAEFDQTALHWREITEQAGGLTAKQIAIAESHAIRQTPAVLDLRLHVAGDSPTRDGSRLIANACTEYVARGLTVGRRLTAFGYTHAWRDVLRSDWWQVSMLASCETAADVRSAWRRGYAAAVVVPAFPDGGKAFELTDEVGAVKCVPCPAQTSGTTCSECRLCMSDTRLLANRTVIAFETHGGGRGRADETVGRLALPMAIG